MIFTRISGYEYWIQKRMDESHTHDPSPSGHWSERFGIVAILALISSVCSLIIFIVVICLIRNRPASAEPQVATPPTPLPQVPSTFSIFRESPVSPVPSAPPPPPNYYSLFPPDKPISNH